MATSRYSSATVPNPIPSDKSSHVYGEPHKFDPLFRGPVHRRKCTDVICCLVFFIVIFLYLALGVIAWLHGDPKKLIHPTNSYGQFCGQKGTHNFNKPILFYFNILKCTNPAILINLQCPTTQMCVSKCPDRFATFSEMQQQYNVSRKKWEYYRQFCKPEFNNPQKPVSEVLRDDDCPSMIYPSRPIFQRCVPDFNIVNETLMTVNQTRFKEALEITNAVPELQDAAKNIAGLADTKELRIKIAEDYAKSWKWILVGLLMSLAVSLVFIILLRFTAGLLLWITIASVVLLLAYEKPGSDVSIVEVGFHTDLQVYLQLRQTWILMLVCLGVAEASITLMLISLRRRIQVAIALLREASKAISHITSTLFYPLITFLMLTICLLYWAVTAVYLASSGEPVYKVVSSEGSCPSANSTCTPEFFNRSDISKYELCQGSQCLFAFYGGETSYHRYVFWFQLSNLLLFFWLVNFSLALEQCSLAGAFASYYWSSKKPCDIPSCPLFLSFFRAIRYHTGSLAFGALIVSVVQLIKIVLQYMDQKLRGLNNSLSRFIARCLKCCFWCLEKLICYMNHNAYIMMAIYGKSFCTSAREAFFLLMRNVVRVFVLDRVTDFLLFLGKLLVSGGIGVLGLFLSRHIPYVQEVPDLNFHWVPLLTVVAISYLIAHAFFSVYATCVDTLFLCLCDELERNDGSPEKPFIMSPELHRILGKSSRVH
ncbi:choline transporter-like protein 5-A isoform X2 [Takifugu rubripes]|uniref:choline transporter-like protein 5-A isoform X2 n=1 Tax=Takifugu rubripes TaxID=31033 RepID=UPI001145A6F6|nr:choline transporter-like protein 5-A isoform X2 [Takifugu rubripes]